MRTTARHSSPLAEVDLHVVAILICLLILGSVASQHLSWYWCLIPTLVVPQGRILVHAFNDRARSRQPYLAYLVANEVVVMATGALQAWLVPVLRSA